MDIESVDSANFDEAFEAEYLSSKDTSADSLMGRWNVTLPNPACYQVKKTSLVAGILFFVIGIATVGCCFNHVSLSFSFIFSATVGVVSFFIFNREFVQDPVVVKEKVREFFQTISEKKEKPNLRPLLDSLNKNPYFKNEHVRKFIFDTLRHVYLQELHDLSVEALLRKHESALFEIFSQERDLNVLEGKLLREAFANGKLPNMVDLQTRYGADNLAKIFRAETLIRLYNESVMQLNYEEFIRNHIGNQTKELSYCRNGRPFLSLTGEWHARFRTDYLEGALSKNLGFETLIRKIRSDNVPFNFSEEYLARRCAGNDLVYLKHGELLLSDFIKKHGERVLGLLQCTPEEKAAIRSSFYEKELPKSYATFYKEYSNYSSQLQLIGCRIEDFRSRFLISRTDTYQNIINRFGQAAFAPLLNGESLITESYRQKLARDQLAAWNGCSFIDLKNATSEVRSHLNITLKAMAQACAGSDCTWKIHYLKFREKHSVDVLTYLSEEQKRIIQSVFISFVEEFVQNSHTWFDLERVYEKDLDCLLTKGGKESLYKKCIGNYFRFISFNSYREDGAVYEAFLRKFGDQFSNALSINQREQLQPYFCSYLKEQIAQIYGYNASKGSEEGYLSVKSKYSSLCDVFFISDLRLLEMVMRHEIDQLKTFEDFERKNGLQNICAYLIATGIRDKGKVKQCFLNQSYRVFSQDRYQKLRETLSVRLEDQIRVLQDQAKNLSVREFIHKHGLSSLPLLSSSDRSTYLNQLIRSYDKSSFSYKDYEKDLPILRALGCGELEKEEIFSFIFNPQSDVRKFIRELDERELPKSSSFRSQLVNRFTAVLIETPHTVWTEKEKSVVNLLASQDFNLHFVRAEKLLQIDPCNQEIMSLWNSLKGTNRAESFKNTFLETLIEKGPFETMMNSYPLPFLQEMISENSPMFQELKTKSVASLQDRSEGQETPFMKKCKALGLLVEEPQSDSSSSAVNGKREETPSMTAALNQLSEEDRNRIRGLLESCTLSTEFARAGQTYTSQEHGLASVAFIGIKTEEEQKIVLTALGFSSDRADSLIEDIRDLDETYLENNANYQK